MNDQEAYLDKLLNGINGNPEDELEESSLDDADMDGIEEIDEEAFFGGDSPEFEDVDPLVLEDMKQELDSGLDVSEYGFNEEEFQLDEEDLDFSYEENEEDSGSFSDNLFADEEFEEEEEEAEELQAFEEEEEEPEELQAFEGEEEESEELQAFEEEEEEPEESQLFNEAEQDDELDMVLNGLENEEAGAEPTDEISDEEALANILNTFSDDESESSAEEDLTEEKAVEEEAVLNTPEDLGLELEEVEESAEFLGEEEPQGKKKRARKKKKKKKEEDLGDLGDIGDISNSFSEKKPSLLARLLEDDADDEPTPEELEAEAAKKAEKEEKKQAKKEAAEEKKQQAKEAAAAKKAEKEAAKKRKKEMEEPPEPWPPFTKKVIPMIFLFGAALAALIIILSNVLSYSPYLSNARKYFDNRQYEKAYDQLLGIEIKEKDWNFYSQVLLMNQLQVKVTSSENHLLNKERELAVNDLVQAVLFYNDNLEKAEELGLIKEFQVVYADIEANLSEAFGISVEDAEELGAIIDAEEYQERIAEIVK